MSIVNEMLNELQKTRTPHHDIKGLISPPQNTSYSQYLWLTSLALVAILFIVIFKGYIEYSPEQKNTSDFPKLVMLPNQLAPPENLKKVKNDTNKLLISNKDPIKAVSLKVVTTAPIASVTPALAPKKEPKIEPNIKKLNTSKPTEKKVNISSSRVSIANKQLVKLFDQWSLLELEVNYQKLLQLLKTYSEFPKIWHSSLSFLKTRDINLYQDLLIESVNQFPKNTLFSVISAKHYISLGKLDRAYHDLNKIDNKNRDDVVYQLLGIILQKQNKHKSAIENYKKLLLISPDRGEINMAIGISFEALNQPDSAVQHFIMALKDNQLTNLQRQFLKQRLVYHQGLKNVTKES